MAVNPGSDMEHDEQLTALYRAGADDAPPAHLDDAIRAAARREVAAGPRRAGSRRWTTPVSLAAVIVLSVTVVTMMREQGVDRLETMTLPPPPASAPAASAEARRDAAKSAANLAPKAPAQPPSATPPQVAPAKPAPPAAQGYARPRAAEQAPAAAASGSDSRAKAADAEMSRVEEDRSARRESREAVVPSPLLRPAPAPLADKATGSGALRGPAAALSAPAEKTAPLWQGLEREPPEQWIRRIIELRRAGNTPDADRLAAEFRRRFPDERLPDEAR